MPIRPSTNTPVHRSRRTRFRIAAAVLATACLLLGSVESAASAMPSEKPKPSEVKKKKKKKKLTVTKPSPTGDLEACTVVSRAQAEALLGVPLPNVDDSPTLCQYNADVNGPVGSVQILTGAGVKKSLDIGRDVLKHEFTQPPGIGDEAWLDGKDLFFRKGAQWVEIKVVTLSPPPELEADLLALAKTVARSL